MNAGGYEAFVGDPFVSCVAAGKETGECFEAWPEEPNYGRTTLRISMYSNNGYFCTVPPLFGSLCLPVACWVSNSHVPDGSWKLTALV